MSKRENKRIRQLERRVLELEQRKSDCACCGQRETVTGPVEIKTGRRQTIREAIIRALTGKK